VELTEWAAREAADILREQHQTGQKAPAMNLQTSYGPEGRGFESLRAYQSHGNSLNFRGFVFVFTTFSGSWILRWTVDPSRDPYGNLERKSPESAGEEIPHRVRRLLLHGGSHMGVGVEGETGTVMPQHGGEGFYVYAVLQSQN